MEIFVPAAFNVKFVMAMTLDAAFLMNNVTINVTYDPGNGGNYSKRTSAWYGSVLRYQITQRRYTHQNSENL